MSQRYIRYEVVPLDEFLNDIETCLTEPYRKLQRPNGKWVDCSSLRLRTFLKTSKEESGLICAGCGMKATYFAVESCYGTESTHMNLYGLNGRDEDILFTHDHILARALGGLDRSENTQTMCEPCNSKKSREESREVNRLRALIEGPPLPPKEKSKE